MVRRATGSAAVRVSLFCSCRSCATDFATSSDIVCSPSQKSFLIPINVHFERLRLSHGNRQCIDGTLVSGARGEVSFALILTPLKQKRGLLTIRRRYGIE